jgi:hypothetical protein
MQISELVGIVNRFINKVMIIKMMGKGIIIVKVKADMVLMEVNSLPVGIINKKRFGKWHIPVKFISETITDGGNMSTY